MILSVTLQNFEAHEDTTVHFTEGLQLLVGRSNSGKSSLLRALRMVVNNDWDKNMVRVGYEFCRVKVETERGWVEAERGEKTNNWRCQENGGEVQLYQKVGTSVPELATRILGMGERDRGAGIRELPNFQTQLEKHYMLSEIGDKRASSNMIAVMMDNAIGLGGMEDIIKDFSADLAKDRKWLNEKQAEIVSLRAGVLDKAIMDGYEKMMGRISTLNDECSTIFDDISHAEVYLNAYEGANAGLARAGDDLLRMPDVDALEERLVDYAGMEARAVALEGALDVFGRLGSLSRIAEVDTDALDDACAECRRAISVCDLCEQCTEIETGIESSRICASMDSDSLERLEGEYSSLVSSIADAENALTGAREVWRELDAARKEVQKCSRDIRQAEGELDELKGELGVCPLCGKAFDAKA